MRYRVKSYWRSDRGRYQLEAVDTNSGEKHYKTLPAGVKTEKDVGKAQAAWLAELEDVGFKRHVGWDVAQHRFLTEELCTFSEDYRRQFRGLAKSLTEVLGDRIRTIYDLDSYALSDYFAVLRDRGLTNATLRSRRTMFRRFASWASNMWPTYKVPALPKVGRINPTQSSTISEEAMERMCDVAHRVVGEKYAAEWAWVIEGLFWGGLRRLETMKLKWENLTGHDFHLKYLDSPHHRPVYWINSADDKGGKTREFPIAPEFADMLRTRKRRGLYVFNPRLAHQKGERIHEDTLGHMIAEISKQAGISCGKNKRGNTINATPQQFRRTFARRWAPRLKPSGLMALMRHNNIATTMKFYLGEDAQGVADEAWAAWEASKTTANQDADQPG